jgi:hypothetical protein
VALRVRTTKTASGATAVQIVDKRGGRIVQLVHIGSAHTVEAVATLKHLAYARLHANDTSLAGLDQLLDPDPDPEGLSVGVTHRRSYSGVLFDALAGVYEVLGFDRAAPGDEVFRQLVIGRIIEPTSKLDTIRVLEELGLPAPSNSGVHRCLRRAHRKEYRDALGACCVDYAGGDQLTLVLYDVTTLYFQIDREDEYRKPGLSKERRLEPQIVVGLLVDPSGFPLAVHSFEGNTAETVTVKPVLEAFAKNYPAVKITVVADAGMLSASNLNALDTAGYGFVVGSRITKTPYEITVHTSEGKALEDGQIFDTYQSMAGSQGKRIQRRVVYQYRAKRAAMDMKNIDTQVRKAENIVGNNAPLKKNRFLRLEDATPKINTSLVASAKARAGIKGYVTNLTEPPELIIDAYHQLFNVEKSFRMSKSDLKARPIHHQVKEKIDAHLTIVFAALAISRYVQNATGLSIRKFIHTLTPLRTAIIMIGPNEYTAKPEIPKDTRQILKTLRP